MFVDKILMNYNAGQAPLGHLHAVALHFGSFAVFVKSVPWTTYIFFLYTNAEIYIENSRVC